MNLFAETLSELSKDEDIFQNSKALQSKRPEKQRKFESNRDHYLVKSITDNFKLDTKGQRKCETKRQLSKQISGRISVLSKVDKTTVISQMV